jgi:hypothetical protein
VSQAGDQGGQRLPFDELHGVEVDGPLAADRVDVDDVRVVQRRRRPRLVVEALQLSWVEGPRQRQHLESHPPAQRHLFRLVDDSHAAPAHLADQSEVAEPARRLLPRCGGDRARPGSGVADEVQRLQAGVELLGQLGIAGQELVARRRRARLRRRQVCFQRPRYAIRGRRRCRPALRLHCGSLSP